MSESASGRVRSLYVHVPFCTGKCRYCDFYSIVANPGCVRRYLSALRCETDLVSCEVDGPLETVYLGGGTPTVLAAGELDELLSLVGDAFDVAPGAELTVEANPGTLSVDKLRVLRAHGVNRLSLGAQSFDEGLLGILGRRHTARDVTESLDAARDEGFTNLSLDLIFAVPGETVDDWTRDLDRALACDVPHLSTYGLTFEEGTPLADDVTRGVLTRVSEEDELTMYEAAMDTLSSSGYAHYEISNFARPGFACRHNEVYWANAPYLGLGPSAASYVAGVRRRNIASVEGYAARIGTGVPAVDFSERLSAEKGARETAVMNLRRTRGIDLAEFDARTGFDALTLFAGTLETLAQQGLVEIGDDAVRLTRRGITLADTVLSELV
ncbi:MAG TPA: radical SAM family heme chaperone HemW [Planctomycetota bacterium]|nr:radical SAM family heme chaperone HemW [Planctomycetota bacterium]